MSEQQVAYADQTMHVRAPNPPNVYQCIAAVSGEIARTGISKSRKNEVQGYKFRGIDEVFNALAPIISRYGLVILPKMITREVTERTTSKGGALFCVVVHAEFTFVSAADGSSCAVWTYGEAMDSGDKATNKAMSAAYKYAAFQTFCIPTEGDNDADATTHEVAATVPVIPDGYQRWLDDLTAVADTGLAPMRKAFKESLEPFRIYLSTKDAATLAALVARANKADANQQVPA